MEESPAAEETTMPQLNEDVLVHMFRYLNNKELQKAATVCSMWHSAAYSATSWKSRKVQLKADRKLSVDMLLSLAQRGIRHVTLKKCRPSGTDFIQFLALNQCVEKPILTHNGRQFQAAVQHLSETLQTLDLSDIILQDIEIQAAFQNTQMPCLKSIGLSCDVTYNPATVLAISRQCPKLEALYAKVKEMPTSMIPVLGRNMPNLSKPCFPRTTSNFTDETLSDIQTYMPNLESLSLHSAHITNAGMLQIAQMPHLQRLILSPSCSSITEDFIVGFALAKSPIQHLGISECPRVDLDLLLSNIGQHADKLRIDTLNLAGNQGKPVTDNGLKALRENNSYPLRKLYLRGFHVTVQGLAELKKNCPSIELYLNRLEVDLDASLRNNMIFYK